ncbi:MAG: hypothetical protein KDA89_16560, partial [Planctomycetaceae bacterium]|nr:hypothetical protein [Planctomycetaceae bacterium]
MRSRDRTLMCSRVPELQAELDTVLTVDQRSVWNSMTGEPFTGKIHLWPGRRSGRSKHSSLTSTSSEDTGSNTGE